MQDCSNSSALAMELLQSCSKPLISLKRNKCWNTSTKFPLTTQQPCLLTFAFCNKRPELWLFIECSGQDVVSAASRSDNESLATRGRFRQQSDKVSRGWHCICGFNTLWLRQKWKNFTDTIFKCVFLNENVWLLIKISLKLFLRVQLTRFQLWLR